MSVTARTCARTGLRLVAAAGESAFHIGKTAYPPISAVSRTPDQHRDEWNRYDVLGSTYYVAETRQCAYAELLAPFKRANGQADPLAADASFHGMTRDEYLEEIATEWSERDFLGIGAVPASWRLDRSMFVVRLPESGWWVDIEHPDSIASIEGGLQTFLGGHGIPSLTTSVLRSDDRFVTTMIAEAVHGAKLDDDSFALGILFGSKHGGAWCRAAWLDRDAGPTLDARAEALLVTDPDLQQVCARMRITVF